MYLSVNEAAEQLGCPARIISDALYRNKLDRKVCRLVGGMRLIPAWYLVTVKEVLTGLGKLKAESNSEAVA